MKRYKISVLKSKVNARNQFLNEFYCQNSYLNYSNLDQMNPKVKNQEYKITSLPMDLFKDPKTSENKNSSSWIEL